MGSWVQGCHSQKLAIHSSSSYILPLLPLCCSLSLGGLLIEKSYLGLSIQESLILSALISCNCCPLKTCVWQQLRTEVFLEDTQTTFPFSKTAIIVGFPLELVTWAVEFWPGLYYQAWWIPSCRAAGSKSNQKVADCYHNLMSLLHQGVHFAWQVRTAVCRAGYQDNNTDIFPPPAAVIALSSMVKAGQRGGSFQINSSLVSLYSATKHVVFSSAVLYHLILIGNQ